jgi:hypothetical protein
VAILDLTEPLRRANDAWGAKPYFVYDGHWTASGRRRGGAAAPRGHGWLEGCGP